MNKKKIIRVTAILSFLVYISIIIFGWIFINHIQNSEKYIEKNYWNCSDENFINQYIPYYEKQIDNFLLNSEIIITKKNEINYSYSHSIIYTTDDIYLEFTFINDAKFAKCLIDCYFYDISCDALLQNKKINLIFNIINEFGINNIYDFHENNINTLENLLNMSKNNISKIYEDYYYHYDSLVGNLGYYYELNPIGDSGTNYYDPLKCENRTCFQINSTAILKKV